MEGFGHHFQQKSLLKTLTQDVVKTSEIEGELLDTEQIRSSLARRLGIEIAALKSADRHVVGVVEMIVDATHNYQQPLSSERLFAWLRALLPTGASGMRSIRVGQWRDGVLGPMQVVSGALGKRNFTFKSRLRVALSGKWRHSWTSSIGLTIPNG